MQSFENAASRLLDGQAAVDEIEVLYISKCAEDKILNPECPVMTVCEQRLESLSRLAC